MDFTFSLPVSISDLLNSSGDSYYVQNVYQPAEIPEKLKECKTALFQGDPFYIFDHFDTFYSVLGGGGEPTASNAGAALTNLMRGFDLLYLTTDKLGERLAPYLAIGDGAGAPERNGFLNLTKMVMFLFVNTVKRIDQSVLRLQQQQQANMQKKRGKQLEALAQYPDWPVKRAKFLVQLFNVLQFPLERLWSPPVAEENFVNMVCDICYRTLELVQARPETRHVGDTVFQIFGTAIKRYNHALTFPVRILQLLRTREQSSAAIANGIHLLYEEYGIASIFSVLIKDIVEALALDSADTAVSRNFSNFLLELATVAPKLMIPHVSTLGDELLNCESYVLRNCVLQIMGDAIVGELTSEELADELKEARNEFLENLLAHINDVSAHTRARVLQIWHHLKEENAVPLSFQLKVLCEAVERLADKTSTVRKQAVQLIKAFLERNPFAAKLTLNELVKKHEEECKRMEALSQLLAEERKKAEALEEQWTAVIPQILPHVEQLLTQGMQNVATDDNAQHNYDDLVQRISALLLAKEYREAVLLALRADEVAGNAELRHTLKTEEQCVYYMALLKSYMFLANGCKDSNEELGTLIKTVQFLQDSIAFSKVITKAVPKIQELLLSKTNSDVFEAVDLFTTGYLFGIKGTECGMRQMLLLVWSSDKEKRDAVSNAYKKILFTTDQTGRAHAIKVVQQLSRFLADLEYGHYTAMECLVREWVASDDIDALIIQVLFERFTLKLEGTGDDESRLALQLLIMCAAAKATVASANIAVIETIGLGERAKRDPRLYAGCLQFLLQSVPASDATKYYKRYESDCALAQRVRAMFLAYFFHPRLLPDFDELAMRTLEFFYGLCQQPDLICEGIVRELMSRLRQFGVRIGEISATQQAQALETPYSQPLPDTQRSEVDAEASQLRLPVFLLTRFVFTIGYMALKEMIFLDIDVYNNMKYRQELTECEQQKQKLKDAAAAVQSQHLRRRTNALSLNMSATESLKRLSGTAAEPQQEPDEDLVGATAEDNIAELINHICEDVLLHADNALLAKVFPYILEICKYPAKYHDASLQQAATLTLIRFMCVSSRICEAHVPFLMNILNMSKNIKIRCNIVIGMSDLTFRFPNIIEPWTGHFYTTLHEENTELRLTAVKMLSHLILHEMIRVKGQIADLAMCIVDADLEIRNITQQFFKEIANKSNILYNVLPDIISKLSDNSLHHLEEEKYRTIMRYILGLIQKDRQVETLVEKLCLRFIVTREERQWRDIAYCLSLLTYNERSMRKLLDLSQHYKDKVQIDEVYQSFRLIISNTNKLAKQELKTVVAELEARLNECLDVGGGGEGATAGGTEDADAGGNGGGATQKSTRRPRQPQRSRGGNASARRGGRKRQQLSSDDDSSSGSGASDSGDSAMSTNGAANARRRSKAVAQQNTAVNRTAASRKTVAAGATGANQSTRSSQRSRVARQATPPSSDDDEEENDDDDDDAGKQVPLQAGTVPKSKRGRTSNRRK